MTGPGAPFVSHMPAALEQARAAAAAGEVPVGAIVADPATREIIAAAPNAMRALCDPTAHAEIRAIRAACTRLGRERLTGLDLWVTLEPCPMCAAAIGFARIRRLYYGAADSKGGAVESGPRLYETGEGWRPEVYAGLGARESAELLGAFFKGLRP